MDKHIDRVRKLLAIANSSHSPEEAGTAFAHAQKIMTEHAISEEQVRVAAARQLGQDVKPEPVISRIVWTAKGHKAQTWIGVLGMCLAEVNGCSFVQTCADNAAVYKAWGRASDLDLLAELLRTIPGQIDALCDRSPHSGRTARNNFRLGAVQVVNERLRAAAKQARSALNIGTETGETAACTAIALRNIDNRTSLAIAARAAECPRMRTVGHSSRRDSSAYESGRAAGAQVNTNRGRALT